jgi:Phage Mu protein F like protein.
MSVNKKYEVLYYPKVKKTIDNKFDETISIVKSHGVNAAISTLSKDLVNPELTTIIQNLYANVGVRNANMATRDLKQQERGARRPQKDYIAYDKNDLIGYNIKSGGSFGFNTQWVQWILNYLHTHLIQNITFNVNKTTRDYLLNVLNKSITEGLGIDETVRLLDQSEFSAMQAARIVRTEINAASNAGTLAAGQTYEYEMQKKWIAVHDNRTRGVNPKDHASHIGLDGTIIDFEDHFVDPRNGDLLLSPGDPKASAESVINCRCQMSLKPKRDHNGRLIPKRISTVVLYPSRRPRQQVVTI